eukprot:sb/3475538/
MMRDLESRRQGPSPGIYGYPFEDKSKTDMFISYFDTGFFFASSFPLFFTVFSSRLPASKLYAIMDLYSAKCRELLEGGIDLTDGVVKSFIKEHSGLDLTAPGLEIDNKDQWVNSAPISIHGTMNT